MPTIFRCAVNIFQRRTHVVGVRAASLWIRTGILPDEEREKSSAHDNRPFLCPSNPEVQKLLAEGSVKNSTRGTTGSSWASQTLVSLANAMLPRAGQAGQGHEQIHQAHYNVIKMVEKTRPTRKCIC